MSRVGLKSVAIPDGVNVELSDGELSAKGPLGQLSMPVHAEVSVTIADGAITVLPKNQSNSAKSFWGTYRALIANLVEGVSKGFEKKLLIEGVGYRANLKGKFLNLQLGYSHDIDHPIPDGIKIECPDQTTIVVSGNSKQKVGQVAAEIRAYRKPEPYKGKGVRYDGEYIFRKEGKKK